MFPMLARGGAFDGVKGFGGDGGGRGLEVDGGRFMFGKLGEEPVAEMGVGSCRAATCGAGFNGDIEAVGAAVEAARRSEGDGAVGPFGGTEGGGDVQRGFGELAAGQGEGGEVGGLVGREGRLVCWCVYGGVGGGKLLEAILGSVDAVRIGGSCVCL